MRSPVTLGGALAILVMVACLVGALTAQLDPRVAVLIGVTAATRLA